ncbi:MAG: hypothetical protein ACYC7I_06070 [Gammaproteobacteria bacterium]
MKAIDTLLIGVARIASKDVTGNAVSSSLQRVVCVLGIVGMLCAMLGTGVASAGSIFLTGHDPDFHATVGANNAAGGQGINVAAINFVTDPTFNPFATGASKKFLYVESNIPVPVGHTQGKNGIVASGYTEGTDFVHADASTLNAALNGLGTAYDAIVVASDYGGILTQAELDILNARSTDIINFLNAGGGLYAMAESDGGAGLTPSGGRFGFLPFVVTSTAFNQTESGNTVTAFGTSLGLTNADVNGNFSHNMFTSTGGMQIVDTNPSGDILSLATRSQVTSGGVVPLPSAMWLFGSGLVGLLGLSRGKQIGFIK